MLLPSANDAATTLAIATAGSVKAFVAKMNARAAEMGLTNTHFNNANGLHVTDHYSSAADMAKLASAAMRDPVFRRIVSTKEYLLPRAGGRSRLLTNSNELLRDVGWVNGIKTGSTPWAGYCLVASASRDGLTLISVVLGAKDEDTRAAESKALLSYGFERCRLTNLIDQGAVIADVPAHDLLGRTVRLVTGSSFTRRLLGPEEVTGKMKLYGEITLPVHVGDMLGELQFFQDGVDLGSVTLIAAQSVERPSLRMILDHLSSGWSSILALSRFLGAAAALLTR
jgi:D-alanyl-D-alanine carboxypeptidase (penicillin-binding protein 5/6)